MEKRNRFREYWFTLSMEEKAILRDKILSECHVLYPTIRNWIHGQCKVPLLAQEKIEEITGVKIFN